jgi:hypothetical protein
MPIDLRMQLLKNGYLPLPAIGKRVLIPDWSKIPISAEVIRKWETSRKGEINTGIRTGKVVGVDLDVTDNGLVDKLQNMAFKVLGPTHYIRVGRAPKSMLIYRNETPIRKMETDTNDKGHHVEILGSGQQFIGYGMHPDTKKPYTWMNGDLSKVPLNRLPATTPEKLRIFCEKAGEVLGVRMRGSGAIAGEAKPHVHRELTADEIEDLRSAIKAIPNEDLPYDTWIGIGFAIKESLGDSGYEDWVEFSEKSDKNDPDQTETKWEKDLKPNGTKSAGSLFYLAMQEGWEAPSLTKASIVDKNRPQIKLRSGYLNDVVEQSAIALEDSKEDIYKQGGRVVTPVWEMVATSSGKELSFRLNDVKPGMLLAVFPKVARYLKFRKSKKAGAQWATVDCPREVVQGYLDNEQMHKLRSLRGVVTAPTLRGDGSMLDTKGYDVKSGLLYEPCGMVFPAIPKRPTRKDALKALDVLSEPLREFPFAETKDKAVALSNILTAVIRRALPTAPLHAFSSPVAGSGKSLLVDIASLIATGQRVAVTPPGYTKEELEKRLISSVLAGAAIISLDNLTRPLEGEMLCQCVSQESMNLRPLGKSVEVRAPIVSLLNATGNNLTAAGDMTRRTLSCYIDSQEERPELRKFERNETQLIRDVRQRRPELVMAALTMIRARVVSDYVSDDIPLGSFNEWSRLVRDTLTWLGVGDPVDSMEAVKEGDPVVEELRSVMEAWYDLLGEQAVSLRELFDLYDGDTKKLIKKFNEADDADEKLSKLIETLREVKSWRDASELKTIGMWLSSRLSRPINSGAHGILTFAKAGRGRLGIEFRLNHKKEKVQEKDDKYWENEFLG